MKKFKFLIILLIFSTLLSGCKNKKSDKKYVAVIAKSANSDFFINMKNGAFGAATEYNVKVTFEGPENEEDYETQNKMILNAVKNGADAILLSAIDYNESDKAVNTAVKNGVKVITVDSGISSNLVSLFIGTDNKKSGRQAGEAVLNGFNSNTDINIGIVSFSEQTDNSKLRERGFKEAIAANQKAKIIGTKIAKSNIESAKQSAKELLKEYPQINVLVGFNEWITLGIGEAVKEEKAGNYVKAVGFDCNVSSVAMLETGEMDSLIVQNPFAMGYLGVKNALKLIEGNSPESDVLYTDTVTVSKTNMFDEDIQKLLFRFD